MATIYIDYVNGNDGNDGSTGSPLKTLTHALVHAGNSDTILVRNGNYQEYGMTISETSLTIRADTGHAPVFKSSITYAAGSWSKTGGQTNVYETAYTAGSCWSVWNGSTKLTSVASVAACDAASNSRYFDDAGDKVYVNVGGGAPGDLEIIQANDYALIITGTGITLDGLTFRWQFQAVDIQAGGSTVQNCIFKDQQGYDNDSAPFSQLQLSGATHTVDLCTFTGTGDQQTHIWIPTTGSAVTVSHCTFTSGHWGIRFLGTGTNTVHDCSFSGIAGHNIYVKDGTVNIDNCDFTGAYSGSSNVGLVHAEAGTDAVGIADCTFADGYEGVRLFDGTDTIDRCTFSNFGHSGVFISTAGTLTVSDCISTNDGHSGFCCDAAGATMHCRRCITNHTGDTAAPVTGSLYGFVWHGDGSAYHCIAANLKRTTRTTLAAFYMDNGGTDLVIKNCIAFNCAVGLDGDTDQGDNVKQNYNCYHDVTTAYDTGYSAGANDITGDPNFLNVTPGTDDFHLGAGSSCIDTGLAVAGINDGYQGSAPDIGAYETAAALTVADASHAHTADSPALAQHNVLAAGDATHVQTAGSPALVQYNALAVGDAAHAHSAEAPTLTAYAPGVVGLTVVDASHVQTAESLALTQHGALDVADAAHGHSADSPSLAVPVALTVADASHAHTAEAPALTQHYSLIVADASHAHAADAVSLAQHHILEVWNASQLQTADSPGLVQHGILSIENALHAHTAGNVNFFGDFTLVVQDAAHGHTAESPTFDVLTQAMLTLAAVSVATMAESYGAATMAETRGTVTLAEAILPA